MSLRKILIAFDGSENSFRSVDYVGSLLKSCSGYAVSLLYVERLPERDAFTDEVPWKMKCKESEIAMREKLEQARKQLMDAGLGKQDISSEYLACCASPYLDCDNCSQGTSIARDIIRIQKDGGFDTIVIGRRGVSKAEEFLFGSVSTKIIQAGKGCTVWVVS